MNTPLNPQLLESLRGLGTCAVANAIEDLRYRLRNEGFTDGRIQCLFPDHPPVIGYAVTARIHTSNPPVKGRFYADSTDWWSHILSIPSPRIVVIQDADETPAFGSYIGEVHANILAALGAVAVVTNGAVRDLGALDAMGIQVFAARAAVSHAYAHLVEFGRPVVVAGLVVQPGDLLHADGHGVLSVPISVAVAIPPLVARNLERDQKVVALCRSADFSLEKLRGAVEGVFPDLGISPDDLRT